MSYLAAATKPQPIPPILTIVGFPGVGKSTLAALFPNAIFIQAETASTVFEDWEAPPTMLPQLPAPSAQRQIRTSKVVLDQLRELATAEHEFKTVVFDTVTSLNQLLETEVVEFDENSATNIGEAAGGFNKGYMVLAGLHADIRRACDHLRKKGMSIIFLAHAGVQKMKNRPETGSEYTVYTVDVPDKVRRIYIDHSDAVIYIKNEEFVIGAESNRKGQTTKYGRVTSTGERVLITSSDGTIGYVDAKNRYNMPQQIKVAKGENPLLALIPYFNKQEIK